MTAAYLGVSIGKRGPEVIVRPPFRVVAFVGTADGTPVAFQQSSPYSLWFPMCLRTPYPLPNALGIVQLL